MFGGYVAFWEIRYPVTTIPMDTPDTPHLPKRDNCNHFWTDLGVLWCFPRIGGGKNMQKLVSPHEFSHSK